MSHSQMRGLDSRNEASMRLCTLTHLTKGIAIAPAQRPRCNYDYVVRSSTRIKSKSPRTGLTDFCKCDSK
jgi:hypothetical protein